MRRSRNALGVSTARSSHTRWQGWRPPCWAAPCSPCSPPSGSIRTRRLRQAGPELQACSAAVARLARDAGLRRPPLIYLGSSRQRDAFSFGVPGRYAVALPPALAIRSSQATLFDPILRHELQHIRRRDVLLAWSARSAEWVLAPILLIPVIQAIVNRDISLLPTYPWRAILLALIGVLVSAGILRSREFEADLGSVVSETGEADLCRVLGSRSRPRMARWRSLLARHPAADARVQVIQDPSRAARVSFLDGFVLALLAALTLPMITGVLFDDQALLSWAELGGPAVIGALFGVTLGLANWRDALARSSAGQRSPAAGPLILGVLAGFALGQAASLAQIGLPGPVGLPSSWSVLITPLAAAAATTLSLSLAAIFADAGPTLLRQAGIVIYIVLSSAFFATVLWMADVIQAAASAAGWSLLRLVVLYNFSTWSYGIASITLALLILGLLAAQSRALARHSPGAPLPLPGPARPDRSMVSSAVFCALASAIVGQAVIVGYGWLAGKAPNRAVTLQRTEVYYWVFALAGVATVLALTARYGRRGLAAGLAAAPLASGLTALLETAVNTLKGGAFTFTFTTTLIRQGLGLGGVLVAVTVLLVTVIAIADWSHMSPLAARRSAVAVARRRGHVAVTAVLAAGLCALLAFSALAGREGLSPLAADVQAESPRTPASGSGTGAATIGPASPADQIMVYRHSFAPLMASDLDRLNAAAQRIGTDQSLSPAERAGQIQRDLAGPARALLSMARQQVLTVPSLRAANSYLTEGLMRDMSGFKDAVTALSTGPVTDLEDARRETALAQAKFTQWARAVLSLR